MAAEEPTMAAETDELPEVDKLCANCHENKRQGRSKYCMDCLPAMREQGLAPPQRVRGAGADSDTRPKSQRAAGGQSVPARKATDKTFEQLESWIELASMSLMISGDPYCAEGLMTDGKDLARDVANISSQFPALRKAIANGDKYASLGMIILHAAKLAGRIGVHHFGIPYTGFMKFVVPTPPPPHPPEQAPPVPAQPDGHAHEPAPAQNLNGVVEQPGGVLAGAGAGHT
jgi:hypothetical protein